MMAKRRKRRGANKSVAIRGFKAANPSAGPNEIARALGDDGIRVTPAFVSTVLSNERRKAGTSSRRGQVSDSSVEDLLQAKKLAEQLGGIGPAKAALDALARILA
jgi:hypothetical protein